MLYIVDGEMIDEVSAARSRSMRWAPETCSNEDDMLFVDHGGNGKMAQARAIAIDGDMGMGDALSIDPDRSESFDGSTGSFKVCYMPGGKGTINHEAMINLIAMADYSDPWARDEAHAKTSTTLKFDGVGANPVMACAIPHSANGTGDRGNMGVRREAPAGCRVFLECWDDMVMHGFGEASTIEGNALVRWDGAAIESVTGMEPSTATPAASSPRAW